MRWHFPPALFLLGALLTGAGTSVAAQRVLPTHIPAFELPVASPRITGFAGRIISASRGESLFGAETEADVDLAENLPVYLIAEAPRWQLDFGVGAQSRFSLSDPKSALISVDWSVGFDIMGRIGRGSVALQLFHESSHLGDEYADHFGARRIDWTREVAMLWGAWPIGQATVRGAIGRVLKDQLPLKPGLAVVAIDYRGRDGFVGHTPGRLVAGIESEAMEATHWRFSTSARVGVEVGPLEAHHMALSLIWHDGLSSQRQFYQQVSRYWGGEIRFDF